MTYAISNGKNYIGRDSTNIHKPVPVFKATTFTDIDKAKNFLKNLPKSFRNLGYQLVIIGEENAEENKENKEKSVKEFDSNFMDSIKENVSIIQDFYSQLAIQRQHYTKELEIAEKELVDIEHAAEFFKLNAVQGYKLYKMMHDARVKRRKAKDALAIIEYILDDGPEGMMEGNTIRRIEGIDNREYRPRVLQSLFSNGV